MERTDTFMQGGNGTVDVLRVIDNSGSMTRRQGAILDRVESFMPSPWSSGSISRWA